MTSTVKIPEEYLSFDYGFSGVENPEAVAPPQPQPETSPEIHDRINELSSKLDLLMNKMEEGGSTMTVSEAQLKENIRTLEAIIVPLLNNLLKTADKDYIYWPNRQSVIEKQLEKVLSITRG